MASCRLPLHGHSIQSALHHGTGTPFHWENVDTYRASRSASPLTLPHILRAYACIISSELDSWSCPGCQSSPWNSSVLRSPSHLAVHSSIETMSPTVSMVPIKVPPQREILVLRARISNITYENVDVVLVLSHPLRVEVANRGGCKNMISIVEVVIVVVRVTKVGSRIACYVCRR